jgi:hypothetical protein
MICAGPACLGWRGSELRPMWRTKSSIIKPARSQGLRPYTNGTSSFRNVAKRSMHGVPMSAQFSAKRAASTAPS